MGKKKKSERGTTENSSTESGESGFQHLREGRSAQTRGLRQGHDNVRSTFKVGGE